MRKVLFVAALLGACVVTANAQTDKFWSENNQSRSAIVKDKAVARLSYPQEFKLYNLDVQTMRQDLFSIVDRSPKRSTIITLPNAAGSLEQFEVYEASNFEPALQAQYPTIRAYSGKGLTDKYASVKLSISPAGLQTMIFRSDRSNEFIEPYSQDHSVYSVYRGIRQGGSLPWSCTTVDEPVVSGLNQQVAGLARVSDGRVRTMRLAQSVTAEYSNYFGATSSAQSSLVLAAVNATMTRCNGVYEKDLGLHLNLVANTTSVFYYNASTDPYSPASSGAGGAWNGELQSTLTSVIGDANYDIGHLFGATGGGGNAGCIGCVCNSGKGSGYTSPADGIPQGDNFDIDYVVHEVGHQLGANHTFSHGLEGTGVNKEVGSGITIMGYAGITSQDVAPHSIAFYHQASINQIQNNIVPKTCPVSVVMSGNSAPVVNAVGNFTIPISTPFALTGSATDVNGDALTYSWEQDDNSTVSGASSVASPTKTGGPNWLSAAPTTTGTRLFPKLATILAGLNVSGPLPGGDAGANTEALSSVSRTLNFVLTVRDNHAYVAGATAGQTATVSSVVTVSNTSGPFAVTAPNTAVTWNVGTSATVTWSVNNTTAAPVSCANVKISLSTDGGNTFPIVLAASTPNDGTENITVPNNPGTTCRVKVEAVGNIFFDIGNANFTIGGTPPACGNPTGLASSAITNTSATVSWTAVSGANNYTVEYKTTAASTWTTAAAAATTTSVNIAGLTAGTTYDWRVRANCTSGSGNFAQAQYTTTGGACVAPTGLSSSSITSTSATVSWGAVSGVGAYLIDYKAASSSTWIRAATANTTTSLTIAGLTAGTLYDWRVQSLCSSSSSAFSQAQFTTTAAGCGTAFEPNETQAAAATISAGVANSAAITTSTDNDYFKITTTGTNNITYRLVGPSGVDFDMTILNSAGTSIGSGTSGSATETVTLNNQAAGTYSIRIFGYNGANSASCYTLTVTVTPVSAGCASTYDNSTNGTSGGAATIPFNTDIKGLISPSGDNDYYRFVITNGGTATITLTTLPADYDVRLYSSNGTTQLAISQNGGTSSETISRTYTAGTYFVRVYGYNNANNATSCYTLRVALGTASRETEIVSAGALKAQVFPNPAKDRLNINVNNLQAKTTIQLVDLNGRVVMSQQMVQNNTSLDIRQIPSGMYLVRLNGTDGKSLFQQKFVKE